MSNRYGFQTRSGDAIPGIDGRNNVRGRGGEPVANFTRRTEGSVIVATGGTENTFADPTSPTGTSKSHTFTTAGTLVVSKSFPTATVSVLLVAGGGGGGGSSASGFGPSFAYGGGGGAGGYRILTGVPLSATSYPIVVGAGGPVNSDGGTSSALGYTNTGGGAGGSAFSVDFGPYNFKDPGNPGGSGGGGGANRLPNPSPAPGGSGTPGQGTNGGTGVRTSGPQFFAGGGGGAGGAGGSNPPSAGGSPGPGASTSFTGTPVTYAVGGPGGSPTTSPAIGSGGGGSSVGKAGIVVIKYPV